MRFNNSLFELCYCFVIVGLTTFGGGSAATAIIDDVVVKRREMISDGEFLEVVMLANILPGPSMIQMASAIGYKRFGYLGAFVAAFSISVPSMVLFLLLMSVLSLYFDLSVLFNASVYVFVVLGVFMFESCMKINNRNYHFSNLLFVILSFLLVSFGINPSLVIVGFLLLFFVYVRWRHDY